MMTSSSTEYQYSIEKPLNREPSPQHLLSSFITKSEGYDRNHGPIPIIKAQGHNISVDGAVRNPLSLSLADLKSFEQHSVICALQCAGNRRHAMRTLVKEVQGIDWFDGAVMNCKWTGPRLRDVLLKAVVEIPQTSWPQAHVEFSCHQNPSEDEEWFGSSISLDKAMAEDADVMVALDMNGEPLTAYHGYPARIIAPGIAGVRSVKWLDSIKVQLEESSNHYQQRDYKILPPEIDTAEAADDVWSKMPPLQEMPINSAICLPTEGSTVKRDENGLVQVRGYALPGYKSGPITAVEVSADDGVTWHDAELRFGGGDAEEKDDLKWAWCLWDARVKCEEGLGQRLLSRASDRGGNMQDQARSEWNLRGIAYNGYGEVNGLNIS
ncbi:sulfite oxidase-like protein [Thelonectria olida]|uniref:Sulfite oxidase-like protein n=1 Tax=Thelonectria olida TaxID=1576542 RepID=A0A9P8W4F2_9HYPO|nr:sulfite oxidase-like protein [Thelonectria olida]